MSEKSEPVQSDSEAHSHPKQPPKDGAHGWIVVAAASSSLFLYMGVIYSWGILQAELNKTSHMSLTSLTFVGSLAASFMCSICIPVRKCIRRFGYQKTAFAGALLLGLGEFLSSWVTDYLGALFVTHGVIFGIGGGLTILPCSTAPLKWFEKRRGLATGVVFGGGSLGAAVMGVVSDQLVRHLGTAWTFRILGFLLWAVCLPAACLIKQPVASTDATPSLQWYRFRTSEFLILLVGSVFSCFPLYIPPYFIPIFARTISTSSYTAIIALTIWNLASTVGRVFAGYTADTFLGPLNSLLVSLLLCGVSALAIWPFASSMGILALFAVINGIGCGAFFSLFTTVLGAVFGPENTMGVLPMVWTVWFFGFFFGTPIASGIYSLSSSGDAMGTEAYRPAAYYTGAMSVAGMVLMIWLRAKKTERWLERI